MTDRTDLTAWLTDTVHYAPTDIALFERAFTHPSADPDENYQRLEFLGDRVLGLAIASWLYKRHRAEPEGKLNGRLSQLVARSTCAEIARETELGPLIRLGKQAREDGAVESDNVLGDVVEALIGALYVDGGIGAARDFVREAWESRVEDMGSSPMHPKSALQEWAAAHNHEPPVYTLAGQSGTTSIARVLPLPYAVPGGKSAEAEGSSKQEAETEAAKVHCSRNWSCREAKMRLRRHRRRAQCRQIDARQRAGRREGRHYQPQGANHAHAADGHRDLAGDAQIVLIDTPGIFAPKRRLDRAMVAAAWGGAEGADLIGFIVDAKAGLKANIEAMVEGLRERPEPKILILNKVDIADKDELLHLAAGLNALLEPQDTFMISATTGDGVTDLKAALTEAMPEGSVAFFPKTS